MKSNKVMDYLSKYYHQHHFLWMGAFCFFNVFFFSWFSVVHYWPVKLWSSNLIALVYQSFYGALFLYFLKMYRDAKQMFDATGSMNEENLDELFGGLENEGK